VQLLPSDSGNESLGMRLLIP